MICDYKNPTSVAQSKIALKTWEDVKNVKVERFQCYTPDTLDTAPFDINWGKYSSAGKYKKDRHEITPTEKSCLTSMFHWWKHIADTGEQVIILEHDAYVRNPKKMMQKCRRQKCTNRTRVREITTFSHFACCIVDV